VELPPFVRRRIIDPPIRSLASPEKARRGRIGRLTPPAEKRSAAERPPPR